MDKNIIIVINGYPVISTLELSYTLKHRDWENECSSVRARFKKKTSRTTKNDKVYESTNWYEEQPGGGLKSVGKEEPDYKKYYPPEPKKPISFNYRKYEGHVLIEGKDIAVILSIFKECLAFRLADSVNLIHPLYKNPQKEVDSVHSSEEISARSSGMAGQKINESRCWNDGDCDSCEHVDECPVTGESDDQNSDDVDFNEFSVLDPPLLKKERGCPKCKGQEFNIKGSEKKGFQKVCRNCGSVYPWHPGQDN